MHALRSFTPHNLALQVRADLIWRTGGLDLKFEIADPDGVIVGGPIGATYDAPILKRADELWKATCFEAFWGKPGEKSYYELNLSPTSGRWNLYRFEDYRQPQPPTPSQDFTLEKLVATRQGLTAHLSGPTQGFEASLTAVIKTAENTHYYATLHAGEKADFHLRSSFVLKSSPS